MTDPAPSEESDGEDRDLPTVSAVIPAYNAADTIERALNSVYAQTYENIIEVIVVDDGSTDATAEIIRTKFPDVKLIEQENQGNAGARNTGVAAVTGDYIAFLDADDEWLPEKTAVQIEVMQRHPGIAMTTCAATVEDARKDSAEEEPLRRGALSFLTFPDIMHRNMPDAVHFCCSGWVLVTGALQGCRGFDTSLRQAVDWEFLLRLTGLGYSVGAVPERLYRYHVLPDSVSHSTAAKRAYCWINTDIIRRYDPSGDGWRSELLTPQDFSRIMADRDFHTAWVLWELGDRAKAREYLQAVLGYDQSSGIGRLKRRFAVRMPSIYYALSTLGR